MDIWFKHDELFFKKENCLGDRGNKQSVPFSSLWLKIEKSSVPEG